MFLALKPRFSLILLAFSFALGGAMEAQQGQTPTAPRIHSPQNRAISNHYQPRYMRNASAQAPAGSEVIVGQPIPNGTVVGQPIVGAPSVGTPIVGAPVQGGHIVGGAPIGGEVIIGDGSYLDGGCGCNDCGGGGCGIGCGGCHNCGPIYDPRDCDVPRDLWFGKLGKLICNSEFFVGVQGFKHQQFSNPTLGVAPENDSFGYHVGFNTGIPLYNLTGGLVSAQIGVNHLQSNLNDGVFATGEREQTFITFGLFRRVDYGLQFGAVADILNESFVTDLDVVQIRAELSWVWAGGSNFGFRWTEGVQDDQNFLGGVFQPQLSSQAIDTYRLFYRQACGYNGFFEFYYGRSDEQHNIYGADLELPVGPRTALYAGFNYLQPDDILPLTDNEGWNIQMGLTFRPRGNDWYKFYHRPLFRVADNGVLIQSRRP